MTYWDDIRFVSSTDYSTKPTLLTRETRFDYASSKLGVGCWTRSPVKIWVANAVSNTRSELKNYAYLYGGNVRAFDWGSYWSAMLRLTRLDYTDYFWASADYWDADNKADVTAMVNTQSEVLVPWICKRYLV